jgi:hypothetical protein
MSRRLVRVGAASGEATDIPKKNQSVHLFFKLLAELVQSIAITCRPDCTYCGRVAETPRRRDGGDELDEIPRAFGFLGRLDLHQVEIVHHALIFADATIRGSAASHMRS